MLFYNAQCFLLIDREEDGLFGDDEEEEDQLGVPKQFYYDEYDDPYDILKMMMNYVDNDAGTCLHLATKVSPMATSHFLDLGKNSLFNSWYAVIYTYDFTDFISTLLNLCFVV